MTASPLAVRTDGPVRRLTIDRAERRNALNDELIVALTAAIEAAGADPALRAVVLTGTGEKAFCAGADLKTDAGTFAFDPAATTSAYATLLRAATECTVPLVARVNGHCLAGGMGLLAVCDLAVAADTARFGLPEVKVGMFAMQVIAPLRDLIAPRALRELALTGEPIDAAAAQAIGLVNRVVAPADLDAEVDRLLGTIVDKSPTAQRRGKFAMRAVNHMTAEQALDYMQAQLVSLSLTEDAREGLGAFNEKREPVWPGR